MRYLSLFSGVEGATLAFAPLGWELAGVSEIEPLPCALLAQRYPNVPNLGDITKVTEEQIRALGKIDVVIGGFPCQDVSRRRSSRWARGRRRQPNEERTLP